MKLIKKVLILSLSLSLGLSSCGITDAPAYKKINKEETDKENQNNKEEEEAKEEIKYEGFEGYSYVLDQGPIDPKFPYEIISNAPAARLSAISPDGEIIRDVLSKNNKSINLGYGAEMKMLNGYLYIFAKYNVVTGGGQMQQATVIDAKTLDMVSQVTYAIDGQRYINAISSNTAIVITRGGHAYTLDLTAGTTKEIMASTRSEKEPITASGKVFFFNTFAGVIDVYDNEDLSNKKATIGLSLYPDDIVKVNETTILAKNTEQLDLISTIENKVVKTVKAPLSGLYTKSFIYDARTNRLFAAGKIKKENRDKVYSFDLTKENVTRELFYTIPASDLNTRIGFHGSMMLGLNPDKNILYIAHIMGKEEITSPDGTLRDMRIGYLSRLSLNNPDKHAPYTEPDAKLKIDDMIEFSPIFFNAKLR